MIKSNSAIAIRTVKLTIFMNLSLAIIKAVAGIMGNSFALIADAIESSSDVLSSIIVWIGIKYASKPPDENYPYGYGKAEPLITFVIVGFLITSAVVILWNGFQNILIPDETPETYTIFVLIGVIIVKEIFFRYTMKISQFTKSSALAADAWHSRSDAITSFAALIGIGIAVVMGTGYERTDDLAGILAAFFILFNAFKIFRPALGEIMDEHSYHGMVLEINSVAKSIPEIINTEKCWVRKSGMNFFIDIHIRVNQNLTVKQGHSISHAFKSKLQNRIPEILGVQIHIEPWIQDDGVDKV